jgi:hypothetical protein
MGHEHREQCAIDGDEGIDIGGEGGRPRDIHARILTQNKTSRHHIGYTLLLLCIALGTCLLLGSAWHREREKERGRGREKKKGKRASAKMNREENGKKKRKEVGNFPGKGEGKANSEKKGKNQAHRKAVSTRAIQSE